MVILLIPAIAAAQSGETKTLNEIFKIQELPNTNKNFLKELPKAKDEVTYTDLYSSLAKIFLGVATLLTFVGLIVAGVMLVAGGSDEGTVTKARQIIMYIAIGILIMAAAYAIVTGITRLKPF